MNVWSEVQEHEDARAELAPVLLYNIHKGKGAKAVDIGHFFKRRGTPAEPDALAMAMAELDAAEAAEREAGIVPISDNPEFIRAASFAKATGGKIVLPDEMRGPHAAR